MLEDRSLPLPQGTIGSLGAADFVQNLSGLANMPFLSSTTVTGASIADVSAHTINSIASSLPGILPGAGVPSGGTMTTLTERSASRNSYSPSMSDSGISVDASSNSSGNNPAAASVGKTGNLPGYPATGQYTVEYNKMEVSQLYVI